MPFLISPPVDIPSPLLRDRGAELRLYCSNADAAQNRRATGELGRSGAGAVMVPQPGGERAAMGGSRYARLLLWAVKTVCAVIFRSWFWA